MSQDRTSLDEVQEEAERSATLRKLSDKSWRSNERILVFAFSLQNFDFGLDIRDLETGLEFSVVGRSEDGRTILRNALIGKASMVKDNGERHILEIQPPNASSTTLVRRTIDWISWLMEAVNKTVHVKTQGSAVPRDCVSLLWWDKRPNFGDAVGPWLVERLTGLSPVNGRGNSLTTPPLATVGSIASWLEQDGTTVWGSGLMNRLTEDEARRLRSLRDISILAVRGADTRKELMDRLGWDVPEVYGDPALLLPRFLPRHGTPASKGKVAIVPHFSHVRYFNQDAGSEIHFVDVEQGLERVVQEIAGARACVSTSLHGIIVAQAYGVPWVWLRLDDHLLAGGDFKFNDFFTTLDASEIATVNAKKSAVRALDLALLSHSASLPRLTISLDLLLNSFPIPAAHEPAPLFTAPRAGRDEQGRAFSERKEVLNARNTADKRAIFRNLSYPGVAALAAKVRDFFVLRSKRVGRTRTGLSNSVATDDIERMLLSVLRELETQRRVIESLRN